LAIAFRSVYNIVRVYNFCYGHQLIVNHTNCQLKTFRKETWHNTQVFDLTYFSRSQRSKLEKITKWACLWEHVLEHPIQTSGWLSSTSMGNIGTK
jgi:hypothetical protein